VLEFTKSSTAGPAFLNAFNTGPIAFLDTSTAGDAIIRAGDAGSNAVNDPNGFTGGFVFFRGSSTAASATITTYWASNIEFDDTSKAGNAKITAPLSGGSIFFQNASSADHATITMLDGTGELSFAPGFFGGGTATAGFATIFNSGRTNFFQDSTAGNATITTNDGGLTSFFGRSTGDNAAFITNAGGVVDISGLGTFPDSGAPDETVGGMTAGSIAGAGTYDLGSKQLTVGSNNSSTTVSGIINDGGLAVPGSTGGSLVKVGTGILTLTGANTYSGGTTISQGTIAANADTALGAPMGPLTFNGGTLLFDNSFDLSPSRVITLNAANGGFSGGGTFDTNGFTTTVSQSIQGAGALTKAGAGTLVLTNANSYSGGTTIASGILQLGNGGTTGSIVGDVADDGTLAFNRSDAVTFPGLISGSGAVTQIGSGTTILTNANSYSGGTTIASGILQLGNGGTTGSIVGDVADNGTLAFDRSDAVTFPGLISGSGTVAQIGTGTTILTADSPYTGRTRVSAGALVVGDLAHPSAALSGGGPITVAHGATLGGYGSVTGSVFNNGVIAAGNATPGFDASPTGTFTIIGNLLNHGLAKLGSDPIIGNVLEVRGAYVGAGGTMAINTFLGGDDSPSDRLVINGGTATGNTAVEVTNVGGPGALTTANGILVVNAINGATTAAGAFTLANDVAAGPFDYRLFQGGVNGGDPGDWFLRNTFEVPPIPPIPPEPPIPPVTPDTPNPPPDPLPPGVYPIIGPRLATDGVVQPIARQIGLTMLGTLHERIGDTLLQENPDGWGRSAWGRVFGDQIDNRYQAFANPNVDGRIIGVQAGFDIWRGSLFPGHRDAAGLYFAYGNSASDVNGLVTNPGATGYMMTQTGTLDLNGYSGGAYWTHYGPGGWYLDGVLQGTAYTGTATTAISSLPTTGSGILISLEGGYPVPLPLGPNFILEPQAQVIWQHIGFSEANDGLTSVDLGSTSGTTGRLGVRGQWTIPGDNGQVWQPYFRANVWRDWGGDASTTFSRVPIAVPLLEQATRLEFGAGITAKVNSSLSFYAQGGYQFAVGDTAGGERQGVSGDLGLRLNW
jgi:outer membrane autotransporter protein